MMTKIAKEQTPIDCDVHFKYICPNPKCSLQHWHSLKEVSIKNFKIVCDCGLILKPKRIKKIDIIYAENNQPIKNINTTLDIEINEELIDKSISVLITYGFTKQEAYEMLKEAYIKNPSITEVSILIKNTLESFGANNVNTYSSV